MDLYFLKYNNYYNRILKIGSDYLPDYYDYIVGAVNSARFNPNDGVSAVVDTSPHFDDNILPDYCLVCEGNNIVSRWFVIDSTRIRVGQYDLVLYRDLLADFYNELLNAPVFVEKGPLLASSPLIFNQEDMTTNQIRQEPIKLADKSNMPWIVGYIPRNATFENQIIADMNIGDEADFEVEDIGTWEYFKYQTSSYFDTHTFTTYRYSTTEEPGDYDYKITNKNVALQIFDTSKTFTIESWLSKPAGGPKAKDYNGNKIFQGTYYYKSSKNYNMDNFMNVVRTNTTYQSYLDGFISSKFRLINNTQAQEIIDLDNKTIYDSTAKQKYKIQVHFAQAEKELSLQNEQAMSSFLIQNIPTPNGGEQKENTFTAGVFGYEIFITLEQVQTRAFVNVSSPENRYHLENEPYDMFCIPYGDIKIITNKEGTITQSFNATNPGLAIASQIGAATGTNAIYDIQLLPYCPVPSLINDDGELEAYKTKFDTIYAVEGKAISAIVWCRDSRFTTIIPFSIPDETDPVLKKLYSQTRLYRLVSPNYGSIFEFNPYKNGGVEYFKVDATYKPFNPYVKIAPVFSGLYGVGGQYDGRGLILNGDFSITQLSDAWANYELQNKNYEAIFNRQIENLEVQNKYQRINEIVGGIVGTVQGGITGATTGAMMGGAAGPYGAAIGAAVGGTAGAAAAATGGIADYFINEALRKEVIDYTKDQFGYQLGNIQALPYSLSKTSALTITNPIIPLLEIYKPTEEEEQAFIAKIRYNGMTVMTIGSLADYIDNKTENNNYFKGKLIRLDNIADDFHIVRSIADELNKGVYL
jgi:hypothetical protein